MDWSRAKTILIIAFACLNGLLGYQLWVMYHEQAQANVVSPQAVEELKQLLLSENIDLQATLPEALQRMGYVQVSVNRMDRSWQSLTPPVRVRSGESAAEKMKADLAVQIESITGYQLDRYKLAQMKGWVYLQTVDDFPVYVAPTEFQVRGGQLTAYRQVSVQVEQKEQPILVVSAHAALKSAVEANLIPAGATIRDVQLGYTGELQSGDPLFLVPVWRIVISEAEPFYVNALTGGVESQIFPNEEAQGETLDAF